jgi:hypothetical protein
MGENPFVFEPTGFKVDPNAPTDTKYYNIDPSNSVSQLFVGRSKHRDFLYRSDPEHQTFRRMYASPLCERILSASISPTSNWYLVTLLRFGDGIDPSPNTRSIFLDCTGTDCVEYPASNRTFGWQYAAWAGPGDPTVFVYGGTNDLIRSYEVTCDRSITSFRVTPRRSMSGHLLRCGFVANSANTGMVNMSNPTWQQSLSDGSRDLCPLPPLDLTGRAEVRVFSTPYRRSVSSQVNVERCVIHSSTILTVVIPFSGWEMPIAINYLANSERIGAGLTPDNELFLNYDPLSDYSQPVSRLPFAFYSREFIFLAVPKDCATGFLIDQADRVRACFQMKLDSNELSLHRMKSITDSGSRVLSIDTGQIFTGKLNPEYFVQRDPTLIVPLLHIAIDYPDFRLSKLVTPEILKTYWNGEIFNEMILLELTVKKPEFGVFVERVSSTFAKPRFFTTLFQDFELPIKTSSKSSIDPLYTFREIETKVGRLSDICPGLDNRSFFGAVLETSRKPMFDPREYSENVRFHTWLQINAIRFSIAPNLKLPENEQLPPNVHQRVAATWAARGLTKASTAWVTEWENPPIDAPHEEVMPKAHRAWWHLRTEKVEMKETSHAPRLAKMFEYVEQLTTRTTGAASGPLLFTVHQALLGVELNHPICDI